MLATFDGGKFRGDCPPRGWAAVIARNVAVDAIRARARERRVIAHDGDALADERGHAEGDLGPERLTDLHETLDRVNRALRGLGPKKARVVYLHDVLGYQLEEVATMLGTSVAAAQSRLVRGRREIIETIGPESDPVVRRGRPRRARRGASSAAQAALPRANLTAGFPGTYGRNFPGGTSVTAAILCCPTPGGSHGCIRNAHAAHRAGGRHLRGRGVADRGAPRQPPADRVGPRRRLRAGRRAGPVVGGAGLRLRVARLLDQVRAPLLGRGVAALLPDHRVLGRPGRLDPVVGVPAVGVLGDRRSTRTATATASCCPTP